MAKVRSAFPNTAETPAIPAPAVATPWPFDTKEDIQKEVPSVPVLNAPVSSPDEPVAEKKKRAPRSDAGVPRPVKAAVQKPAPSIVDLVMTDLFNAVQAFKDVEPRHRLAALDDIVLRIGIVRQIIGG